MTLRDWIALLLSGLGVLMLLISSYGLLRLRGVHQRMQAASVGSTAGIALLLISAGVYFREVEQLVRMVILITLYFGTAPVATTAIARAAYRRPLDRTQEQFVHDDMAGTRYSQDSLEWAAPDHDQSPPTAQEISAP